MRHISETQIIKDYLLKNGFTLKQLKVCRAMLGVEKRNERVTVKNIFLELFEKAETIKTKNDYRMPRGLRERINLVKNQKEVNAPKNKIDSIKASTRKILNVLFNKGIVNKIKKETGYEYKINQNHKKLIEELVAWVKEEYKKQILMNLNSYNKNR